MCASLGVVLFAVVEEMLLSTSSTRARETRIYSIVHRSSHKQWFLCGGNWSETMPRRATIVDLVACRVGNLKRNGNCVIFVTRLDDDLDLAWKLDTVCSFRHLTPERRILSHHCSNTILLKYQ